MSLVVHQRVEDVRWSTNFGRWTFFDEQTIADLNDELDFADRPTARTHPAGFECAKLDLTTCWLASDLKEIITKSENKYFNQKSFQV